MADHVRRNSTQNVFCKVARIIITFLAMTFLTTQAQQRTSPSAGWRQSLDDAWWTGPMLAPSANTLPQGHFLIEPYLYDVTTQGFYNSSGTRVRAPHENSFGSPLVND